MYFIIIKVIYQVRILNMSWIQFLPVSRENEKKKKRNLLLFYFYINLNWIPFWTVDKNQISRLKASSVTLPTSGPLSFFVG